MLKCGCLLSSMPFSYSNLFIHLILIHKVPLLNSNIPSPSENLCMWLKIPSESSTHSITILPLSCLHVKPLKLGHKDTLFAIRIHNVFHIYLLKLHHPSQILIFHPYPSPPIKLSTREEYEVERILDSHLLHQPCSMERVPQLRSDMGVNQEFKECTWCSPRFSSTISTKVEVGTKYWSLALEGG